MPLRDVPGVLIRDVGVVEAQTRPARRQRRDREGEDEDHRDGGDEESEVLLRARRPGRRGAGDQIGGHRSVPFPYGARPARG